MLHVPPSPATASAIAFPGDEAVRSVAMAWQDSLLRERRMAANTVEAYARDLRQFLDHLQSRHGTVGIAGLVALKPRDIRGFMAARRPRR